MPFDFGGETLLVWMFLIFFMGLIWILFMPQLMTLQSRMVVGKVRKSVQELEGWARESRRIALSSFMRHGRPKRDIERDFDNFLEFFTIEPVYDDPIGVLRRMEHILDVRKKRFENAVSLFAPKADPETAATLEMIIEGAMASNLIFRMLRHFTLLAEKTKSYQLIMLIQMYMPIFKEYSNSFRDATRAFTEKKPIGDGVGAMVATKFIGEAPFKELVEGTVYAETRFEGRKLLVVKAKGPGGRLGKPGELIKKLAKKRQVDRIIMIDAAQKLEGEKSGQVIEGVGAAIGGPPTEKHKIEVITVDRKIPLDAMVIKESFKEAITQLNRSLAKATDLTVEMVKKAIRERTKPVDTVIVAGIGNTIGIGQRAADLPKEYPQPPEIKGIESDRLLIGK